MLKQSLTSVTRLDCIRALWCEVLALAPECVQTDSHFLLLGGDSLQLARLLERVRATTGVSLGLHDLVRFATPARMAACCDDATSAEDQTLAAAATGEMPVACAPGVVPATLVQQGIWLAEQLAAPQTLYLSSVLLHLHGRLDLRALQIAINAVLLRHPALCARLFPDSETRRLLFDTTGAAGAAALAVLRAEDCAPAELHPLVAQALRQPLSLQQGPLFRLRLFRLAATQHVLLLACHHTISDGWSGGILLASLAESYAAALAPGVLEYPPADWRFVAYCRRESLREATYEEWLPGWRYRLAGMHGALDWLWQDRVTGLWPHTVQSVRSTVPAKLLAGLRRCAQQWQFSVFILFLHAVRYGLYACSGEARQLLLVPVAQRLLDEESSIGCFIQPLLLVARFDPAISLREALLQDAAAFKATQQAPIPLAAMAAMLRPRPLPDGNPWTSILFAFQSYPHPKPQWPGLQHHVEAVADSASQYALRLEVSCSESTWQLQVQYATTLLDQSRISALLATIMARLQQLAEA
ncbi:MAG: condensation domain-containing protein [Pseudohongiellaceae bacterium]